MIVFEEVGCSEKALTSLKFFKEEAPHVHIMATGSNIGLCKSFPVGQVDWIAMYPMTFSEFLEATGNSMLSSAIDGQLDKRIPKTAHEQLINLMREYWFVGGMPESVSAWVALREQSLPKRVKAVEKIKADLIRGYSKDFGKLVKGHDTTELQVQRVYNSLANQIATVEDENAPKFVFKGVLGNTRTGYEDVVNPIEFLRGLMLAHKVLILDGMNAKYNAVFQIEEGRFKLLPHDIGIMAKMIGSTYYDIMDAKDSYKGFMAEVFVANEMISSMNSEAQQIILHSFKRGSSSEIEFLLGTFGNYVPLEVKSGKKTQSKSLRNYMDRYSPTKSIKLSAKNPINEPDEVLQHYALYRAKKVYDELMES